MTSLNKTYLEQGYVIFENLLPLSLMEDLRSIVDNLVNNAATSWAAPLAEYPLSGWDRVFDLNGRGVSLVTVVCTLRPTSKKTRRNVGLSSSLKVNLTIFRALQEIVPISRETEPEKGVVVPDNCWCCHNRMPSGRARYTKANLCTSRI